MSAKFWDIVSGRPFATSGEGEAEAFFGAEDQADAVYGSSDDVLSALDGYGALEGYGDTLQRGEYDTVFLDGREMPGIARVNCIARVRLDMPRKIGRDGATLIDRGHEPATVDITLRMWHPQQWAEFVEIVPFFWRLPGETPISFERRKLKDGKSVTTSSVFLPDDPKATSKTQAQALMQKEIQEEVDKMRELAKRAISIYHPVCYVKNVTSILFEEFDGPEIDEEGVGTIRLRARQYIPHKEVEVVRAAKGTGKSGAQATYAPAIQAAIDAASPPSASPVLATRP